MYQAWPWGGTPAVTASPTAAGFVQPATAAQVGATQWPAGYNYAAMTPEMQQQWAAAWATQAQYAYGGAVPVAGQAANTAVPYPAAFPESQAPAADSNNAQSSSEQPKNPPTELAPKDSAELDKLKQLKEQAEQWKTLQQPTTAAASWNYTTAAAGVSVSAPTVTTSGEALSTAVANANASQSNQAQLDQEEEEFERQFKDWEKQFESWKEQNIGHPDKEAFAQYEKQWQEWRATLLQKKEQMQKAKADRAAAAAAATVAAATNQVPASTTATPAVDPNAALYYQQAQYMYMQNYMYPGGMPAVPPTAGAPPTQQFPYGTPDGYGQPTPAAGQEMQQPNSNRPNAKEMNNFEQDQYGQSGEQFPPQNEYQNFDEYGNMYPSDMDQEQYQRDMNFGRGRGARGRGARGRGRGRGRGGRWSDPNEGEGMPPDMRQGLLDNPGEFPPGPGEFPPGGPGEFRGGPEEFPNRDFHDGPGNFGRGPLRDYPMDSPGKFRDGQGDFNAGPLDNQGPPFDYPPENFGPGDMDYPPEEGGSSRQRRNFPKDERFPFRDGPPGKTPLLSHDGSSPSLLPPRNMNEGPTPQPSNRYPPDDFDEEFPEPPFDDHFPPRGEFEGGYPPPMGEFGGRPPFREDYPPPSFENRFPQGRGGRFPPRRGRFPPHGDFDRFGGPPDFPQGEGPPFGPPDDRFPFPGEGPRMAGRGPRHFGPGNRFPDDPFFHEGGPGPMRFKSKDYTHRSAEDFDPHYEFENDFQEDVMQFRDNFSTELSVVISSEPVIFSEVNVETFDYGHGLEPMTTTTTVGTAKGPELQPPVKVFNYAHRGGIQDTDFPERELFQEKDCLPPFPGDRNRDRDYDKPRDRAKDLGGRESRDFRGRDFEDRESRDFGGRDSRDFGSRESRDFGGRDSREPFGGEAGGRDSREYGGRNLRDSRDHGGRDFKPPGGRDSRDQGRDPDHRDSKRGRERHRDEGESRDKRPRWDPKEETERNGSREKPDKKESFDTKGSDTADFKSQNNVFKSEDTTLIDDLLSAPKRETRPKQMVIILRGLPGSGKTYVAKLIKDKEIENGGSAPRILSLDDYFMGEVEVNDIDPDTGKKVKRKEFKFEFESEMEETYRSSLFKSFKKTIDDRFFPFIIVDAIHNKSKHYEQYWSYAKQRGFQVYVAEMDCKDPSICFKRNTHNRSLEDITKLLQSWESKPKHFMDLDVRSLLQDVAITEVEMEVEPNTKKDTEELDLDSASNDADDASVHVPSRWEKLEATEEKLDQLDGLRVKKSSSMEDYLQLPDDYEERKCEPGKKRVRWADLEERKEQDRLRAIGFVVGQTDWNKMTDPSHADRALTKTKFF